MNRQYYKGTGLPTMYTTETYIAKFLTLKDTIGRRIYKSLDEVATELRVSEIVPVEVMEEEPNIVAILVNPADYVLGADKGGQVSYVRRLRHRLQPVQVPDRDPLFWCTDQAEVRYGHQEGRALLSLQSLRHEPTFNGTTVVTSQHRLALFTRTLRMMLL